MDGDQLVQVLNATLHPATQQEAASQLKLVYKNVNFVSTLFQLVMSDQVAMPVRQAGAIYLKNMTVDHWKLREEKVDPFEIPEQDQAFVRENIVEAVIQAPSVIQIQLTTCISHIVKHDFPDKWPGIAEKCRVYLISDDARTWLGALMCLYQLCKNFEYKKNEHRGSLNEAMRVLLPIIHQRCTELAPDQTEASQLTQKQILKVFFALIQFFLPMDLITKEVFNDWMVLVTNIIKRPVPEEVNSVDVDERSQTAWWKCKKWAIHIITRSFERYGSPGNVMKEYTEFADWYLKTYAGEILQVVLGLLKTHVDGAYISPRVLQLSLSYINQGVSYAVSWEVLKPHMQDIIEKVLFPLMSHSEADEEMWDNDPVEYIKMKYDVFEEFLSPVTAAQTVLYSAVAKRSKVLQNTMVFVKNSLESPHIGPRQKAGVLHVVGAIADVLLGSKSFEGHIEQMLVVHVYPLFNAPEGYLRARACWVIQSFSEIIFKQNTNLVQAMEFCRKSLLEDKELPVRVEAAMAIQCLLKDQEDAVKMFQPYVKPVILQILDMLRNVEIDDLSTVLQKIFCTYVEDVKPLAVDITTHLAQTLRSILGTSDGDGDGSAVTNGFDGSEDKAIAAMGVMDTLDTIVTLMENNREILVMIESIVMQVVGMIIEEGIMDLYEPAFALVGGLTVQQVSPRMWTFLPTLEAKFNEEALDYFTDMMPALHNYATVDGHMFLSDPKYMNTMYNMCDKVLSMEPGEEVECHAAKLLEVILLQYKGQIDQAVGPFVKLVLNRLTRGNIVLSELRTMCLQVVIAALYYDPVRLIESLQTIPVSESDQQPMINFFVEQWLADADCFLGLHDRKMAILGLCILMDTASATRPQVITNNAARILPSALTLFTGLAAAYASRAEDLDSCDGGERKPQEIDVLASDEDDVNDAEYADVDDDDEDDEDDSDLEDCDEENETILESFETPLDAEDCPIDEYQVFKQTLERIQAEDNTWYTQLTSQLDQRQNERLRHVIVLADQKRAAAESKKIEAAGGYNFSSNTTVPTTFNFGNNNC